MPKFYETKESGHRAEKYVREVIEKYTSHVFSNLRVDTLYTKSGTTEIDLIAAIADVILIVEVKNVAAIEGSVSDSTWRMYGLETGESYTALNVLTQNRIHVRSFKDAWFANRGEIPLVVSTVVVPNGCIVPEEIAQAGVITVQQFNTQLARMSSQVKEQSYGYALDFVIKSDNGYFVRTDFSGGRNG